MAYSICCIIIKTRCEKRGKKYVAQSRMGLTGTLYLFRMSKNFLVWGKNFKLETQNQLLLAKFNGYQIVKILGSLDRRLFLVKRLKVKMTIKHRLYQTARTRLRLRYETKLNSKQQSVDEIYIQTDGGLLSVRGLDFREIVSSNYLTTTFLFNSPSIEIGF